VSLIIYGGSFNPAGIHHEKVASALREINIPNRHLIVAPCGSTRTDKRISVSDFHRLRLCQLAFNGIQIYPNDLVLNKFTPLIALDNFYQDMDPGNVYHVIGSDLIQNGATGNSEIQKTWKHGEHIWNMLRYIVVTRAGYPLNRADLPPRCEHVLDLNLDGASNEIRRRIRVGEPYDDLVSSDVAAYIREHNLYQPEGTET
jgi:nicotinate (nicotinamide) nucleotide adenylyltransferase